MSGRGDPAPVETPAEARNGSFQIDRTVCPTIPPRADYELTGLGRSAIGILRAIDEWAGEHADTVIAARKAYDERAKEPVAPA
ncbi:winged helix-turn-helix transcriptional regulator [Nonomuraea sp. NPDC050153]|uniref:winged helix-turn-helix transcriptional regulator n=1 Tax=Nonomuraea sp. NPDC050153 TaxID=3364359 RepID=UPI0037A02279